MEGTRSGGSVARARPTLGGLTVGLAGLVAVVALGAVLPAGPSSFDEVVRPLVGAAYPTWASALFDQLASLPIVAVVLVLLAVWSWVRGDRGLALAVVFGGLVEIPTEAVKFVVDRPRPPGAAIEAFGSAAGYPSGHTVRAVVVTGLLVLAILRTRNQRDIMARFVGVIAVAIVVALVGLARIASGDHWPTDVIGAAILGAGWLAVAATIPDPLVRNGPMRAASDSATS